MNHSYTVKDMSGGRGLRMWYEFEDKNAKGEEITVELVSCTRDPGARSLQINFDWMLEDTPENRARIIAEI